MKNLALSLLLLLLISCAKRISAASEPVLTSKKIIITITQENPIVLVGKSGAAHACPVILDGIELVLTASHVAFERVTHSEGISLYPKRFYATDSYGNAGVAEPILDNPYVDLAVLELSFKPERFNTIGPVPEPGAEVHWTEFNFTKRDHAYEPRSRKAKVINVVAGHVIFDDAVTPGASGSCLYDILGRVVGIISWYQILEDGKPVSGAPGFVKVE